MATNHKIGFFTSQLPDGAYQPEMEVKILNHRRVVIGNPITAYGLVPPANLGVFSGSPWMLIDPESAKTVPMTNYATPYSVAQSVQAINSALNSGLIAGAPAPGMGNAVGGNLVQNTAAQSALGSTSLAPPTPTGCSSCGGSIPAQINGVNPAPTVNSSGGSPISQLPLKPI